jgi:hypothetical protein
MIYHMKRTTLILNERTFAHVKRIAAEERRTLSQIVDDMLRCGVEQRRQARKAGRDGRKRLRLPSYRTGIPRVNVADRNTLYDFLDANP